MGLVYSGHELKSSIQSQRYEGANISLRRGGNLSSAAKLEILASMTIIRVSALSNYAVYTKRNGATRNRAIKVESVT